MNTGLYGGFEARSPAFTLLDEQYPVGGPCVFANLPYGDYREFKISWMARSDDASTGPITIRLTIDGAASGYAWQAMQGNATTASASQSTSDTALTIGNIPGDTATEGYYGIGELFVLGLGEPTVLATVHSMWGMAYGTASGNLYVGSMAGYYNGSNTNSIEIVSTTGNFMGKTRFTLYGMT